MATRRRTRKPKGPTYSTETIEKIRSPRGVAAFAHLREPDEAFNKVQYTITVYFDPEDSEFKSYHKKLKAVAKDRGHEDIPLKFVTQTQHDKMLQGKYPELAKAVGTPYYAFAAPATDERVEEGGIKIYGADAKVADSSVDVWGGDTVRVAGSLAEWSSSDGSGGLKIYLNGVQLLSKSNSGGSMFEPDDEFLSADAEEEEIEDEEDLEAAAEEGDDDAGEDFDPDDIPF